LTQTFDLRDITERFDLIRILLKVRDFRDGEDRSFFCHVFLKRRYNFDFNSE